MSLLLRDPTRLVTRARELYDREVAASDRDADPRLELTLDLDAESRTLTMIGAPEALDRFAQSLRAIESHTVVAVSRAI